jgi:PAS domain S-box-containing protein
MALPLAAELGHTDSLELLHHQTAVLELVAGGTPLPEVLRTVTEALEELIPGSRCSVLLLDTAGAALRHGAAPSLPAVYSAAIDGLLVGPSAGSCGTCAHLDTEVVAEDIAVDPRWDRYRELALPHGLRSCWSSPIRGRGEDGSGVLGTFAVYHCAPHRPSPRERRLVERFTHLSSVAIEHARLYGALGESEERFRRAFEDNAIGMALTGLDGRFVKVNRALREMLGRSEEALLSSDLAAVLEPGGAAAVLAALRECTTGERGSVETTLAGAGGVPVRAVLTASVVHGADGRPAHLSVNVLDVTARRAAERERHARREAELARGAAEAASRAKSQFLSALSHEMRTPLQAVTGFTELLGTLDLTPERRTAALGHIASATTHILALVDDVLDIAAVEAGALRVHLADVELGPLVGEVLDLLGPLATDRDVALVGSPAGRVRADPRRLRQVLLNIVTNAVRYNRAGGSVRVTAAPDGERTVVAVADTGPGIPPHLVERLFVPFDRLGADGGPEPGAGLGMVLARGLTEAMGGRLAVHSEPGRGTTVEIRLDGAGGPATGRSAAPNLP